jgi:hypothetical protein
MIGRNSFERARLHRLRKTHHGHHIQQFCNKCTALAGPKQVANNGSALAAEGCFGMKILPSGPKGRRYSSAHGTAEQAAEKLFLYRKAKNRSRQEALGAIRKGRLMV